MGSEEPEFSTLWITKLSAELQEEINTYLSPEDLAQLSQLSRHMRDHMLTKTIKYKKDKEHRLTHDKKYGYEICIAPRNNGSGGCTRKKTVGGYCAQHYKLYGGV